MPGVYCRAVPDIATIIPGVPYDVRTRCARAGHSDITLSRAEVLAR